MFIAMAPEPRLEAKILSLVLEMTPVQGLGAVKLSLVLETAPLQGLRAEKWEMTRLCHFERPAGVVTSSKRYLHSLRSVYMTTG